MEIQQRLELFYKRLTDAAPAASAEEALALVCRLIEEVEAEFCPVPRETPPPEDFTGRMYAPQEDRIDRRRDGIIIAEMRHHRTTCFANGGIVIVHKPSNVTALHKEGKKR